MKRWLIIWLSFGFYLPWNASTADRIITVGVENQDYFPHYGLDTNGEYRGFAQALLERFAATEGLRLRYHPLPIGRLYREFVAGKFDLKYPDNPGWSPELKTEADITYSDPVATFTDGILTRPEQNGLPVEKLKRVGTILGFTLPKPLEARVAAGGLRKIQTKHYDSLLLMALLGNRVDGIYASVEVGLHRLQQLKTRPFRPGMRHPTKEDTLVFQSQLPFYRDYYHLSSIHHPELIARFNAFQRENTESIRELKRQYGLILEPDPRMP